MVVQDCACAAPARSTATPAAPRRRRNGVMLSPSVVGAASSGIATSYAAAPARGFTLKMGAGGGHCQGGRPARRPLSLADSIRPSSALARRSIHAPRPRDPPPPQDLGREDRRPRISAVRRRLHSRPSAARSDERRVVKELLRTFI